jgi:hypothetical protein
LWLKPLQVMQLLWTALLLLLVLFGNVTFASGCPLSAAAAAAAASAAPCS